MGNSGAALTLIQNTERWFRDLEWAVRSPFLMDSLIAISPDPLEVCDAPSRVYKGHRVGYYFESLISHWLKESRGVEMLAEGYQVMEEGRTLGELDFVFRDESGLVNHWEVAAKFFLYDAQNEVNGSHLIGPNVRDTFERKRDKIFGHQLPLSARVFPEVSIWVAFVKGRIFYHPLQEKPDELPDGLASGHLGGIWLRHSELSWLQKNQSAFHVIKKPHWLAQHAAEAELSFQELERHLKAHFAHCDHPVLLGAGDLIFVVADHWPQQAW